MPEETAREYIQRRNEKAAKLRWSNKSEEEKKLHAQMMVKARNEKRLKESQTNITTQ